MKQAVISFRVIGDSGPLTVYWSDGPFGDAVESKEGNGVVWLSAKGELLGAEFDDVRKHNDHQTLTAPGGYMIEIDVKNGTVKYEVKRQHARRLPLQKPKSVRQKATHTR
jgi:hypothetical protein